TTDGLDLQQVTIPFVVPVASGASIGASPSTVTADGTSASMITVTLKDSLNRGTPGKLVTLSQGAGHSIVNALNPSGVTDSSGEIKFNATNVVGESVTYTATDVTDGELPIPGSATVSFTSGPAFSCGTGMEAPQAGWSVTSPASGFTLAQNCVGVS